MILLSALLPLIRRRRAVISGHCENCRYDLTGNQSGICPECGTPTPLGIRRQRLDAVSDIAEQLDHVIVTAPATDELCDSGPVMIMACAGLQERSADEDCLIAFVISLAHTFIGSHAAWWFELRCNIAAAHYLEPRTPGVRVLTTTWTKLRRKIIASNYRWWPTDGPIIHIQSRQCTLCGIYDCDGALFLAAKYHTQGMGMNFAAYVGSSAETQGPNVGGWLSRQSRGSMDLPCFRDGMEINVRGIRTCMFIVAWNEQAELQQGIAIRWWFLTFIFGSLLISKRLKARREAKFRITSTHLSQRVPDFVAILRDKHAVGTAWPMVDRPIS